MNSPRPLSLLCELTYRCNLQCPYCYNPLDLRSYRDELSTEEWRSVLRQAAAMGVVQVHFSGGEPTLRTDLWRLVEGAASLGLYSNLITQGTFLDDALLDRLVAAGSITFRSASKRRRANSPIASPARPSTTGRSRRCSACSGERSR